MAWQRRWWRGGGLRAVLKRLPRTSGTNTSRSIFWCKKIKVAENFSVTGSWPEMVVAGISRERDVGEDFEREK